MGHFLCRPLGDGDQVSTDDGSRGLISFTLSDLNTYTNEFNNFIGYGGFGSVYHGIICGREERNINGRQVAVKVSRNAGAIRRTQWEAEKRYLPGIMHQNIIQLIGYCETSEKFYLVYPFMQNGNVKNKLADLDWSRTLKIIKGAACAIEELHDHKPPLIYRDLKLENLLLDKDFTPKLADFGAVTPEGEYLKIGTAGYTDPVIMNEGAAGTKPNDIYSLGVVILQLIMKEKSVKVEGSSLHVHISNWAVSGHRRKGDAVHQKLKRTGCSKSAARAITELGLHCVKQNTQMRPTITQVLEKLADLEGK